MSQKRLLQPAATGTATVRQALDRLDAVTGHLLCGQHAGANSFGIDKDRAGPAIASVTADFRARKAEVFSQHSRESPAGACANAYRLAVQFEIDLR